MNIDEIITEIYDQENNQIMNVLIKNKINDIKKCEKNEILKIKNKLLNENNENNKHWFIKILNYIF